MLPKEYRLKKKKEFDSAFKGGRTIAGTFLSLKIKRVPAEELKIGFVVPQKIFKGAVQRNRLKRMLREAVRPKIAQIKKGYHLIFLAKKETEGKTFQELGEEIERLLEKAGLKKHD